MINIKPLEWGEAVHGTCHAHSGIVTYYAAIAKDDGKYYSRRGFPADEFFGPFDTLDEAKAAAQSDFASRIRSCLLDKPEAVEGEPVAPDGWVKPEDIDKMVAALGAFRGYEWWMRTENPNPDSYCLAPLVLQNMKLGYENGTLEPTMSQFKNLLTTAMFYQQKCQTAAVAPADTDAAQSVADKALRQIISDAASALPNGAFIHPEASVGFMEGLPKEIDLVCSNLQNEIDRLRRELEEARRALEPFANLEASIRAQRAFLQLLICPDGDDHPENWTPKIRAARAAVVEKGR